MVLQISSYHFISLCLPKQNSLQNGDLYPYREDYTFSSLLFNRTSEKFGFGENTYYFCVFVFL